MTALIIAIAALGAGQADAEALQAAGRYRDAEPILRRALAAAGTRDSDAVADAAERLADNLARQARPVEAEPLYRRAFDIRLKLHGAGDLATARSAGQLAGLLADAGRLAEAERLSQLALTTTAEVAGKRSLPYARMASNHAGVLAAAGKGFEAEGLYRSAAIALSLLGEDHALDRAVALNNWAAHLQRLATGSEAPLWFRRSFTMRQSIMSAPPVAVGRDETPGPVEPALRRRLLFEASTLFREALAIRERRLDPVHPDIANSLNSLAANLIATGRAADSIPLLRRAWAVKAALLRADDRDLIVGQWMLADALAQTPGREAESLTLYRAATRGILSVQRQYRQFDAAAGGNLRSYAPVFKGQVRVNWRVANPAQSSG